MLISIVIPVYNGANTIGPLTDRLIEGLGDHQVQIVLVNDGSRDNSHDACLRIFEKYPSFVTYLQLSRNFGEHNAVMAGLNHATGDYVVIMDDDFQNPPEEVLRLVEEAERNDWDVVYTYYDEKQHSFLRNIGSAFNGWMANFMLNKPKDLYLSSFKCLSRFLVREIIKYEGPSPYIDGLVLSLTDNIGRIKVRHDRRAEGRSNYTVQKLIMLWLSMFVNFSVMPLRVSFFVGVIVSIAAGILAVSAVVEKLLHPDLPPGWASLAALILLFSGLQLCVLGLVGEYVGRALLNTNRLPQYVIRSTLKEKGRDDGEQAG
jgi:undecaprenyl-phosphate 4-deoxy-4-formamido-L-arabinose transferase